VDVLEGPAPFSPQRRNLAKAQPLRPFARGASVPNGDRHRAAARLAQLQPARRALARKSLPIDCPLADARAILAPALEGFSPTPELLEIAEAQALMKRSA
jgi:hypothetical protein